MIQKCPTMSPHQEATASSTSSLIWGLNEFTKVVDPDSAFETTPSIQVSILCIANAPYLLSKRSTLSFFIVIIQITLGLISHSMQIRQYIFSFSQVLRE